VRTTNIAMIALGVLAVALAIVVPGLQIAIVVLGGGLAGWGSCGAADRVKNLLPAYASDDQWHSCLKTGATQTFL
jgi:hypothetical protein